MTHKRCLNKDERQKVFLHSIMRYEGASDFVYHALQIALFSDCNSLPEVQLLYIVCLLERGDEDLALVCLKDYFTKYGLEKISNYMPVAALAVKNGISDPLIEKSAAIFNHLEKNRAEKFFENFLSGKSVAVVGNSPNVIGRGCGTEIDSHDIVMRMNMFNLPDEYATDTGKKINVYVSNANARVITSQNYTVKACECYDWIYIAMNIWHVPLFDFLQNKVEEFLNVHFDLMSNSNIRLCAFPPDLSVKVRQQAKIAVATTGLKILYHLKEKGIPCDVYGFNEVEQNGQTFNPLKENKDSNFDFFQETTITSSYYRNLGFFDTGHNFNQELRFRRSWGK